MQNWAEGEIPPGLLQPELGYLINAPNDVHRSCAIFHYTVQSSIRHDFIHFRTKRELSKLLGLTMKQTVFCLDLQLGVHLSLI